MHDTEVTGRLLLALLLASGLHLALLFGVPADWWALHYSKPPRFEVVLLPPVPVPAKPARGTSIPEPTAPAAASPPSVAQPPEPTAPVELSPPVSKPIPEPVESAQSPPPVTRIEPTVATKPATSPKRPPAPPNAEAVTSPKTAGHVAKTAAAQAETATSPKTDSESRGKSACQTISSLPSTCGETRRAETDSIFPHCQAALRSWWNPCSRPAEQHRPTGTDCQPGYGNPAAGECRSTQPAGQPGRHPVVGWFLRR
ncbi:hypothetical protein E4P82_05460 [Candidatus Competibacter phosphatis]|uniref:Energy transducer TonB n=1 Tax=Candidatus Competibacter phosphatis TaxID=221280 RepID=A0ABX1TH35_9GAMM|nr:hypothetical protein [Candidatus Competibacter phosphatis]